MLNRHVKVTDELYDQLLSVSVREHPQLQELRERTATMPMGAMQVAPEEGQFLQWLVSTLNVRRAVEVGVFTGYSALAYLGPSRGHYYEALLTLLRRGGVIAVDNVFWSGRVAMA